MFYFDITITEKDLTNVNKFQLYNKNDRRENFFQLKIGLFNQTSLVILCNELDSFEPDNLYQSVYTINDLLKLNEIFAIYSTIEKSYNLILKLFSNKNVKLEKEKDKYVNLFFTLLLPDGESTRLVMKLKKKVEYVDVKTYNKLLEENNQLKKQIEELKSTIKEFEELLSRKKDAPASGTTTVNNNSSNNENANKTGSITANMIFNNNNKTNEVNNTMADYSIDNDLLLDTDNTENSNIDPNLTAFNSKYKTDLLLSQNEIDLVEKNIDNNGISLLSKIKFINPVQIWLDDNNITNIEPLLIT